MKVIIILLSFALTLNLGAAKVALVPTAPELATLADQVLAAMSNESGAEFLERAEIETILKERKLSASGLVGSNLVELGKTLHADLFAIITARPGEKDDSPPRPSGLIVYDARNGFRLVNAALPEKLEDCVKVMTEKLRRALETQKHSDKAIFLSVAAIRDAGVPERFKYKAANLAVELERRLCGMDNVIVLERDYLGSVNQERELTGQMFKLAPSARLIRLEFSPGSSPEIVNLTMRVTDIADNELFRYENDNCFSSIDAIGKTVEALGKYLQLPLPLIPALVPSESIRYYSEFRFFYIRHHFRLARQKLDAAIVLDPNNVEFRLAHMALNQRMVSAKDYRQLLKICWKNLEHARELELEFPKYQGPLYTHPKCFPLPRFQIGATRQDFAEWAQWAEIFRPKYEKELRRLGPRFDLSDGINTWKEWQNYNQYCKLMVRFELYYDLDKWQKINLKRALEHLEKGRELSIKYPEQCAPKSFDTESFRYFAAICHLTSALKIQPTNFGRPAMEPAVLGSEEYIRRASEHPLLQYRIDALQLELLRQTIVHHYDPLSFEKDMQEYCNKAKNIDANLFNQIRVHELGDFLGFSHGPYYKIAKRIKGETLSTECNPNEVESLFHAIQSISDPTEKARKFIELSNDLLEYKKLAFSDADPSQRVNVNIRKLLFDLAFLFVKEAYLHNNQSCKDALDILNQQVDISRIAGTSEFVSNVPANESVTIQNALYRRGVVYLLFRRQINMNGGIKETWRIGQLDMTSGQIHPITNWTPEAESPMNRNRGRRPPFDLEGNTAVIAGNSAIYVITMNDRICREIKELPANTVMGVVLLQNRLYAFVGQANPERKDSPIYNTMLLSFAPDGSDRQLHISTGRDDRKNSLDSSSPFSVYNMIADRARNRLLFNAKFITKTSMPGLWEYEIETNSSRGLIPAGKNYRINSSMTGIDNTVFCSYNENDFYIFDMSANHANLFFSRSNKKARYCLADKFPVKGIDTSPSFFCRANQIWFGGDKTVVMLTLPDIGCSPLIFMPPSGSDWHYLLLPHPDNNSAIAITDKVIYRITPKE